MVKPRDHRVPIMMSDQELQMIDDWRFGNRIATRSDAIRRLCQIALVYESLEKSMQSGADLMGSDILAIDRLLLDHPDDASIPVEKAILERLADNHIWIAIFAMDWRASLYRMNHNVEAALARMKEIEDRAPELAEKIRAEVEAEIAARKLESKR